MNQEVPQQKPQKPQKKNAAPKAPKIRPAQPADTVSIATARKALADILAANPTGDEALKRTVANLARKIDGLMAYNPTVTAAGFRADDSAVPEQPIRTDTNSDKAPTVSITNPALDSMSTLGRLLGHVPCSTPEDCALMVQDVVTGRALHPKRTGNPKDSTVIKTIAQTILNIPDSGTGGWVDGNMISVVQNVLDAHIGTIIFAVDQTTGARKVLAYGKPNKDLEAISAKLAVLYTTQSVSAPLMTTGSNSTVQAQLMLQQGATTINPCSILPGQMASVVDGGVCPIENIGSEVHTVVRFTATDPEALVERFSSFDIANQSLVRVPNPSNVAKSSTAWVSPSQTYSIVATGSDSTSAAAAGYSSAVAAAWGNSVDISPTTTTIWQLSNNNDAWTHMLYGDLIIDALLNLESAYGAFIEIHVLVDNGDGTVTDIPFDFDAMSNSSGATGVKSATTFHVDTRGPGAYAPYRKMIVSDIVIKMTSEGSGDGSLQLAANYTPIVSVNFLNVPAMSHYLGTNITGAKGKYSVAITSETHVQVHLLPYVLAANFVECDNKPAYVGWQLQSFLQLHRILSEGVQPIFQAGSFLSTVGSVLKAGGKIGKLVAPLAGNTPLGRAASMAGHASAIGKIVAPRSSRSGQQVGQPRYDGMMAGTFGPEGPLPPRAPNFSYPAYDNDGHWLTIPVVANGVEDPEVRRVLPTRAKLGSPSGAITGRSGSFAMMLSSLAFLGFPVKPGLYSGEVVDMHVERAPNGVPDEIVFTVLPVKGEIEKIAASVAAGQKLRGLFESGWYADGAFTDFDPFSVFNPAKTAAAVTKTPPPPGYPGSAFRVRAWRL